MKNDAANARNAKTRALKPRKLKPGEEFEEGTLPTDANVTVGPRLYGDARMYIPDPRKRRHIAIDFPLFVVHEIARITAKVVRGALKAIAHVFLLDVAAKGAGTYRQKRRVRKAIAAHDKARTLLLPPEGVEIAKPPRAKPAARVKEQGLPLDFAKSDRIEPRVATRKRVGRPIGARDKHPRKKRVS